MLTLTTFPIRNVAYHWRSSVPVVLGVAIGAAVLAGALLIGDSLRGSLKSRAFQQLSGFRAAYLGTQFLREDIAEGWPLDSPVHPVLVLRGSLRVDDARQLPRVTVYGVRDDLALERFGLVRPEQESDLQISATVAQALKLKPGEQAFLNVEKASGLPRSSFLGRRDSEDVSTSQRVRILAMQAENHASRSFTLSPGPQEPLNVFMRLSDLQKLIGKPGRVNALLTDRDNVVSLNQHLASRLTLADWGLRITSPTRRQGYLSIESEQLVLNPAQVRSLRAASESLKLRSEPTMAYLANTMVRGSKPVLTRDAADPNQLIPYSVVVGLNPSAAEPLGPFLAPGETLQDDELILADWPDSPFQNLRVGEPITLAFFKPEMEASLDETSFTFRFKGLVPLTGPANDPNLTPPFPGITDKLRISEWNSPFEMNRTRLRSNDRNEKFWEQFKTTPKAYMTLAQAERLFGSRFGSVTSVRVATTDPAALEAAILKHLDPSAFGLQFSSLTEQALAASRGGTDFGALFLAFSWLLIFTGLLLVGLLFRLSLDRRAKEIGLLLAAGYAPHQVRRVLLREGLLLALLGSLLGLGLAVGYAQLLLTVLIRLWPDQQVGHYLTLHVQPASPVIALFLTLLITWLTLRLSIRGLLKLAPPALLRGETQPPEGLDGPRRFPFVSVLFAGLLLLAGVAALAAGGSATMPDERSTAFFGGGGMLLLSGLMLARAWLVQPRRRLPRSVFALGLRSAARRPVRALLSASLIAVAAFLVVSVESFRRRPDQDFASRQGGSGGFPWRAEAEVPLFNSFGKLAGQEDLAKNLQKIYQDRGGDAEALAEADVEALKPIEVHALRRQSGDDASCLNLYQAGKPRLLGVPESLIARGGFRFTQTLARTPEELANPWLLLQRLEADQPIPFIAEQNSALFMLKLPLGGILELPDETGQRVKFQLVAMLQDSVFQSELLIADTAFRQLFPKEEGFKLFLIDPHGVSDERLQTVLQTGFRNHGLILTRSAELVAQYQAVVGAYLSTFQLLGGFALLVAILGLGIVILRNVWERSSELALLRAVGYTPNDLQRLILAETLLILGLGLLLGLGAALASVIPSLSLGASLPVPVLMGLGVGVIVVGLAVSWLATRSAANVPILQGLRRE